MLASRQKLPLSRRLGGAALIVALHVALATLAVVATGARPWASPPPPVQVRLIELPVRRDPQPLPPAAVRLAAVPLPTVPLPEIPAIEPPREPVAASSAASPAPVEADGAALQPAAPAVVAAAPARETAPVAVEQVAYLRFDPPQYPALSRRLGEQGVVLLRVEIDEDGVPRSVQVHRSSGHPRLDAAAAEAL